MGGSNSKRSDDGDSSSIVVAPATADAAHTDNAEDAMLGAPGRARQSLWRRMFQSCRRVKVTNEMIAKKRNTMRKVMVMSRARKINAMQISRQIAGLELTMTMVYKNPQMDPTAQQMALAQLAGWLAAAKNRLKIEQTSFNHFLRQQSVAASHLNFLHRMQQSEHLREGYAAISKGMNTATADAAKLSRDLQREEEHLEMGEEERDGMLDSDAMDSFSFDSGALSETRIPDVSALMEGIMAGRRHDTTAIYTEEDTAFSAFDLEYAT